MKILLWIGMFVFIVSATTGCKDKYNAHLPPGQSNLLVVEGFINANGKTTIKLSRSVAISDPARIKTEPGATVTIMGDDNSIYPVRQTIGGTYVSDSLTLRANQQYRLYIKTSSGSEYLSEYSGVKQTPAIDSITWKHVNDAVQISVSTHDPQNNTRYYKWDYEETWEIRSAYQSEIGYINGRLVVQTPAETEKKYYCWRTQNSVSIFTGSSAQLENDIISFAPLLAIPLVSEKTSVRYSILVNQYSLDRKAYDFYRLMKSNTESLGSVFDPLPSDITGNITCVSNAAEKVIGYVPVSTLTSKRIFITAVEFQSRYRMGCETTYVVNHPDSIKDAFQTGALLPYQADGFPMSPKGYFSSTPQCVDCTLRGGSSVKPAFW